jgi:hypothetical protein
MVRRVWRLWAGLCRASMRAVAASAGGTERLGRALRATAARLGSVAERAQARGDATAMIAAESPPIVVPPPMLPTVVAPPVVESPFVERTIVAAPAAIAAASSSDTIVAPSPFASSPRLPAPMRGALLPPPRREEWRAALAAAKQRNADAPATPVVEPAANDLQH